MLFVLHPQFLPALTTTEMVGVVKHTTGLEKVTLDFPCAEFAPGMTVFGVALRAEKLPLAFLIFSLVNLLALESLLAGRAFEASQMVVSASKF